MKQGLYFFVPQKDTPYVHSPTLKKEPYIHSPITAIQTLLHMAFPNKEAPASCQSPKNLATLENPWEVTQSKKLGHYAPQANAPQNLQMRLLCTAFFLDICTDIVASQLS